jgi:hypothetical protein
MSRRPFSNFERAASPRDLLNCRFQQGLYRAYHVVYSGGNLGPTSTVEADRGLHAGSRRLRPVYPSRMSNLLTDAGGKTHLSSLPRTARSVIFGTRLSGCSKVLWAFNWA